MRIFALILASYVFFRAVLPLHGSWRKKAVLAALVLAVAFKFQLLRLIGGPMFFAPRLPGWFMALASWLFAMLFIFFFLLLATDAARLVAQLLRMLLRRRRPGNARSVANMVNLCLLTAASLLAALGMASAVNAPELRREEVILPAASPELDGTTVAVLADLHIDSLTPVGRLDAVVERVNALNPDLIVIVGDIVDGEVAELKKKVQPLRKLRSRLGIFAVPGNHEYYSGYREWRQHLTSIGITMLENSHILPPGADGLLAIAGITDRTAARYDLPRPDLSAALAGIPPRALIILLAHQLPHTRSAAGAGVDLQLSGHTHGGMIRGLDLIVAAFNRGFVAGWYQVESMRLYVNRGTFIWSGFPVRIGIPSEITLLTIRSRS